tara:strand:+ start:11253 stop:11642 length:390 start_codon:yes stop_codon:yes gene_type:complete
MTTTSMNENRIAQVRTATYNVSDLQLSDQSLMNAIFAVGKQLKSSQVKENIELHDKLLENFNTYDVAELTCMFNNLKCLFVESITKSTCNVFDPKYVMETYPVMLRNIIVRGRGGVVNCEGGDRGKNTD